MHHDTPLLATIVAGLVLAFIMGSIAHRLKVSPLAGYLLAGVLVGPFTPGFVADGELAAELAELGVILLMFGVGLHFSLRDLLAVRRIAVPGAVVQILAATLMGLGLGLALGWSVVTGIVFGLALSVASTVVLLRALQDGNVLETERGRIAVGWLIVEDLVMVLALVLIPAIAGALNGVEGGPTITASIFGTIFKVAGFVALMLIIGRRVIPWTLHWVVHSGSRELFRLAVLAIALGVAFGAAYLFNVSFALGAFFAGMILGETQLSRRATEETLPLRDAFAVLFFVSVGMLFNPAVLWQQPLPLLATVLIIIVGKSAAAYALVRAFRYSSDTAFTVAASLAQIGEFSFILATLSVSVGLLPPEGRDLILAGAMISIFLNLFLFKALTKKSPEPEPGQARARPCQPGDIVLVGFGQVGTRIAQAMAAAKIRFTLIEDQKDRTETARAAGHSVVTGNATLEPVLREAGVETASTMLVAIPEGYEAAVVVEHAKAINPGLHVIVRAHSDDEAAHLAQHGADRVVLGEQELAIQMLGYARQRRAGAVVQV